MSLRWNRAGAAACVFWGMVSLGGYVWASPQQQEAQRSDGSPTAPESPERRRARALYEEGVEHYRAGQFEEALKAFKESYNLSGEPKLLYNLALASEQLREFERAIAFYEIYLEEAEEAPDAAQIRSRVDELERRLASGSESATEGESLSVTTDKDKEVDSTVQQGTGEPLALNGEESPEGGELRPESSQKIENYYMVDEDEPRNQMFWPGLALGIGGMLVAGGTITGILAYKEYDSLKRDCSPYCSNSAVGYAKDLAIATDVLCIVGAVGLASGALLWILRKKLWPARVSRSERSSVYLVPGPQSDGAFLVVKGRF